ncbi:MAG: DUF1385 domain-containing protein [Candidatus Gracilibacteria bacterium]
MNKDEKINFAVGGQALIEGVMMRAPHGYVMAVRRSTGEIVVERQAYVSIAKRIRILGVPVIRGVVNLIESLIIGVKALMFSNTIFLEGLEPTQKNKTPKPKDVPESSFKRFLKMMFMTFYFLFLLAFSLFLFKFLPLLAANTVQRYVPAVEAHYSLFNLVDGLVKISIFLGYIVAISFLPDIQRVFGYHGAEHQSIWAYEKDKPLTVAAAQEESRFHPRCGTSFILLVFLLSVAVYTVVPPAATFWMKLVERIALLPLIAGLSYEALKFCAKYEKTAWGHAVVQPGLWLQRLTTRKPSDDMQEVALVALKAALEEEKMNP